MADSVISYIELSILASSWGKKVGTGPERDEEIRKLLKENPVVGNVDRGSLLRIARATEATQREITGLRKEMKVMMAFWKELKQAYLAQKEMQERYGAS